MPRKGKERLQLWTCLRLTAMRGVWWLASTSHGGSYTPKTERVSPPPPPRHTLDLTSLVQSALEGIGSTNRSCEEDLLFNKAVRTLGLPGTEDDVLMDESGSGQLDDIKAARCYLDEDDAL